LVPGTILPWLRHSLGHILRSLQGASISHSGAEVIFQAKLDRELRGSIFPPDSTAHKVIIFGDSRILAGFVPKNSTPWLLNMASTLFLSTRIPGKRLSCASTGENRCKQIQRSGHPAIDESLGKLDSVRHSSPIAGRRRNRKPPFPVQRAYSQRRQRSGQRRQAWRHAQLHSRFEVECC